MKKNQTDFNQFLDENSKQAYAISVLFKIFRMEVCDDSVIKNMNRVFLQLIYTALKDYEETQAYNIYHNTKAPFCDVLDFIKHLKYINNRAKSQQGLNSDDEFKCFNPLLSYFFNTLTSYI